MNAAEQLAQEFAALNTAIERAHQAIADLRTERKLLADLLIEVREATQQRASTMIEEAVTAGLKELGDQTEAAMAKAVERVGERIDHYLAIALGQDALTKAKGQESIPELIERLKREGRA